MRCTHCAFDNPDGAKFCGACGKPLDRKCNTCGFKNPREFKFCGNCGTKFSETHSPSPLSEISSTDVETSQAAERRHLTVMFCDVVGSTELSNQMDPEDLRWVITTYQKSCQTVVDQYEGHVAQYLGDGLLVYFGYPVAHENDAHRAVSSGLGILDSIQLLNKQLEKSLGIELSIRIGIHTGLVVVGDIGSAGESKKLALGATPNIAARLEGVADPDSVVISTETHKLVESFFDSRSLGKHVLKGIPDPVEIFAVKREKIAKIRIAQDFKHGKLPLVGRSEEIKELLKYWEEAKQGRSKIVLLSAEAGMGKSRILQDLTSRLSDEPGLWLMSHRCSPYHRQTAYYPFIQAIRLGALKLTGNESNAEQRSRLETFFTRMDVDKDEMMPLFAGIMGLSLQGSVYEPSAFSVDQQKRKITDTLISVILKNASEHNLLLVFEDLHWMDSSSLEVLNHLLKLSPDQTMLTVLSFRPDFEPRWKSQAHLVSMSLPNLPESAVKMIIDEIAGGKNIPAELSDQIIRKTDGIPLFVEELTKMVLDSELVIEQDQGYHLSGPISSLAIPSTLHDSLVARLDRLSKSKIIAQIGAVIGRDFDYSLIKAVSNQEESLLRENLEKLVQAELLQQSGIPPKATYTFRHALIRDAAYQSLLKSNQRRWHRQIGTVMLQFPEMAKNHPEIVAYQMEKGGEIVEAITYWTLAGELLRKRQAYDEALVYLERAKGLIGSLKSDPRASLLELNILAIQAPIYLMTAGWGSPLTFKASSRLVQLASSNQDKLNLFRALFISTTCELFSGDISRALENGNKALVIAEELNRKDFIAEAHRIVGQISIFDGSLNRGLDSFSKAISVSPPGILGGNEFTGSDPITISQIQNSHVLWLLGYPDQALKLADEGVENARIRKLPYDLSISLFVSSFIYYWAGEYQKCFNNAKECHQVSKEFGNHMFTYEAITYIGAYRVLNGEVEAGLAMIYDSISEREQRAKKGINLHSACFGELCLKVGAFDKGLEIINKAIEFSKRTKDQHMRSEMFRLKGDLLKMQDARVNNNEIEKCYATSLEITKTQQAKSLELRIAMSIARHRQAQGNLSEALNILKPVYSWFQEGHKTKDLLAAETLISELSVAKPTR